MNKAAESHIEAFEMNGLGHVLQLSWPAQEKKQRIGSEKAGVKRTFFVKCSDWKVALVSLWHKALEKEIIQGTLPGTRKGGRPKNQ